MLRKLIISISLLCFLTPFSYANDKVDQACAEHNCQIIIDAGSTGTRLHLYAFDKDENLEPINIKELQTYRVNPGFSSLKPEEVAGYLDNLMSSAYGNNTKVHFYATAGMRLLPDDKQQELYSKAHEWFADNSKWNLASARTISGVEEGVFGWLGIYYSLGELSFELPGFIEIGGASMQVVFPISNYTDINRDNIVTVKLQGRTINLFAHSFLGFGTKKLLEKFANNENCFPVGFPMSNGEQGTGNSINCAHDVMAVLNANNYVSQMVKLPQQRNPTTSWFTVGAVSSISQKAPIGFTNKFAADELFVKSSSIYCEQDWSYQKEHFAANDKYIVENCLVSSYFNSLITEGFGIDAKQVFFNDKEVADWTFGALIANIETEHHS